MGKVIDMPSGAKLDISVSPFADSRALYQSILEEGKALKLDPEADVDVNFFKDLFCSAMASKKIEAALNKCFERVTYKGLRVDNDTWEPVENREDYFDACFAVAKENITPFTKNLSAKYSLILEMLKKAQA